MTADRPFRDTAPLYYAAAAGDIAGSYRQWKNGVQDPAQTAVTYSGMFYDLCTALGRRGAASYPAPEEREITDERFTIRSRPPIGTHSGWRYHLAQLRSARWLLNDIRRSGATDAIVMDGVTYWFLLAPAARRGVRIWLSVHTVLWSALRPPSRARRLVLRLEGWFLRRHCAGSVAVSPRIAEQLQALGGPDAPKPRVFRPLYEEEDFAGFEPPDHGRRPFRVLYSGRIEVDKGLFDLLAVARRLKQTHGQEIVLDVLGDGSALPALLEAVREAGLESIFLLPGHCTRPQLLARLKRAHVVIAPTRSSFPEGLNKAIIEAVLARRPVITSAVCPALDLVRSAAVEVPPDNASAYGEAISSLFDDRQLFESKVAATEGLRGYFFDAAESWRDLMKELLRRSASGIG